MNRKFVVGAAILAALLAVVTTASHAGNTIFLTDRNGQLTFPISPPNRANSTPGAIDNMTIGAVTPAPATFSSVGQIQGAPSSQDTAATLTAAQLTAGILTSNPASGIALTLPLATAMDTALPNTLTNGSFDFSVVNTSSTAANTDTMTTNTGWTLVGNMVLTPATTGGVSARFRARKTAAGAWVLYRLS